MPVNWFLVSWLSWSCPGGWFSGAIPQAVRPFVCKPEIKRESYDRLQRAQDRVRQLGPDATASLDQVTGLRLKSQDVIWTQVVNF